MRDQGWIGGRMLSVLLAASFVLPLAACTDRTANESAGQQLDSAVDKTKKVTAAAAEKAAELAETARTRFQRFTSARPRSSMMPLP